MIERIHKVLIIKYTTVIAAILLICFGGSYMAYRQSGISFMQDSLRDYLSEEIWEVEKFVQAGSLKSEFHKVSSDIGSLHNFAYWFIDGKLVRAEEPVDDEVAAELRNRLGMQNYASGEIYHENVKKNKRKWYFYVLKQDFQLHNQKKGEVFVLANYTPLRKNTNVYVRLALAAMLALIAMAYVIGRLLASKSMRYIEAMYQKQKQFVSDAAHELRTPLSIMLSYTELLEYKPRETGLIAEIKEQILQINVLIDNLLMIARYDNQKMPIRKEKFSLNELVAETARAAAVLCPPQSLKTDIPSTPVWVHADRGMLRQLLYILLDNAVKYTPENKEIKIRLSAAKNEAKIMVADNGIGIKADDIPFIFERFWRADRSRSQKGLGLGLSLADMIVKLHQGKINVRSVLGQGSVFEAVVPLEE